MWGQVSLLNILQLFIIHGKIETTTWSIIIKTTDILEHFLTIYC